MKNTAKKILSLMLCMTILTLLVFSISGCGNVEKGPFVYVTIADEKGNAVVRYEKVSFTENMTVDGALKAIHDAKFEGGAEKGYSSANTNYGLSLTKLWGIDNGGSYGYYVNNESPSSLADTVKENDHIYAYIYTDTVTFSDTYSFFDTVARTASVDEKISLTLSYKGYDESWQSVTLPVADANILIDGKETQLTTNEKGEVSLSFDKKGTYVVTATSVSMTLVTPFIIITVK